MEITQYVEFIKEQFKDIAYDYGFSWRQQNNYIGSRPEDFIF